MKNIIKTAAIGFVMAMSANAAHSLVIFEDNFNAYSEGTYTGSIGGNWNVTSGSVDVVAPGGIWESLNQPGYMGFIDLDGSTVNAGKILTSQKFMFEAGVHYSLSFDLAGDQRNDGVNKTRTFATTIDGVPGNNLVNEVLSLGSNEAFDTYTYSFTGTGYEGRIGFNANVGNNQDDNIGLLLDNVKLESIDVSEPGSLALLGIGIIGLGWSRRLNKA